ncbi:MAG TPA: hypothetical protein VLT84_12020 [Acidobacteriota bacterium]|nr:hypothetical protein [Acidobacteriota bacterium]
MTSLAAAHAAATLAMAGIIWFVQIVHYPLFRSIGREAFPSFHARHTSRTGWVVGPLMLAEAGAAAALVVADPRGFTEEGLLLWAGIALLALVWTSTWAIQVPLHARLAAGYDETTARSLERTNWIRTAGWTARAAVAIALL